MEAYLELVLEQILLIRKFAVETEELGLIRGHLLRCLLALGPSKLCTADQRAALGCAQTRPMTYAYVDLVLLVRVHGCECVCMCFAAWNANDVRWRGRCSRGAECVVFILCPAVAEEKEPGSRLV